MNRIHKLILQTSLIFSLCSPAAASIPPNIELIGGSRLLPSNVVISSSDVNGKKHYTFLIPNAPSCFTKYFFGVNTKSFRGPFDLSMIFKHGLSNCSDLSTEDFEVDFGPLPAGEYSLGLSEIKGALGLPLIDIATYQLTITNPVKATHETPAANSIQSGIGTIRGWACDASKITFRIDDRETIHIPYKGDRGDTQSVCDDTNNGYAIAMNWARYKPGPHKFTVHVLGKYSRRIASGTFQTRKIDNNQEFLKGLTAEYTLSDFPSAEKNALLRWSEADQNFIIIEVTDAK